ncbi:hypothetical protein [Plantactinospora sp. B5E13]|uniref:hypothetical protein n=1 Tax=unclassified Plantactinospora TaxID=2631981 RepID=UPI00325EE12A
MNHPERRLLIAVDMERYSRRSNLRQYEAQQAFQQLLHEAAAQVGLDRVSWKTQQAGDGELAILPADAREPQIIGRLVPELNRLVRRYNASRLPAARVRLRVALHQGLVHLDGANGFPGTAVNEVCRLCDAPQLKRALADFPDAGVALVVSAGIYRDVVVEYPEELRPERFRQVEVHHPDKEFRESAWICVVDEDLSTAAGWERTGERRSEGAPTSNEASSGSQSTHDGSRPVPLPGGPTASHPEPSPEPSERRPGRAGGEICVGNVRVDGQNAIGHGAMAIGSIGDNTKFGGQGQ